MRTMWLGAVLAVSAPAVGLAGVDAAPDAPEVEEPGDRDEEHAGEDGGCDHRWNGRGVGHAHHHDGQGRGAGRDHDHGRGHGRERAEEARHHGRDAHARG